MIVSINLSLTQIFKIQIMKKITLLIALISLPLLSAAQTWDFNDGTVQGWTAGAGGTITPNTTTVTFSWITGKKPKLIKPTGGTNVVDADTKKFLAITLKNNTEMSELKLKHLKPDGSNRFVKFDITPNLNNFKTYYFDLTNTNWTGAQDLIELIFSNAGVASTSDAGLEVDTIEFVASAPTTEQHIYEFNTDGDTEGWVKANGTISGPATGNLTFTPTANKFAKIKQQSHHVDANTFSRMHIRLKNLSTNDDQIRVIMNGDAVNVVDQIITTSDANFKTYDLDLSTSSAWIGNVLVQIGFRDQDNANNPGQSSGTGDFIIDRIEFSNAVLSVNRNELTDFTLYPNPVNGRLHFNSLTEISKVEVYNLAGQRLMQLKNFVNNSFDVSILSNGVYLVNVEDVENRSITKKIIIAK